MRFVGAYTRGKLNSHKPPGAIFKKPLANLNDNDYQRPYQRRLDVGLRLQSFKRSTTLPRGGKTPGILKNLQPANLLDIGTGRGTLLWPLLDTWLWLSLTCIDLLDYRTIDINVAARGGIENIHTMQMNAVHLTFKDRALGGITLLETLEHEPEPQLVIIEVCRVSKACHHVGALKGRQQPRTPASFYY